MLLTVVSNTIQNATCPALCLLLFMFYVYVSVDIRILLAQTALGVESRSTPIRKITPVAADNPTKYIISTQQLQVGFRSTFKS